MVGSLPHLDAVKLKVCRHPAKVLPCDLTESFADGLDHVFPHDDCGEREHGLSAATRSDRARLIDIDQ